MGADVSNQEYQEADSELANQDILREHCKQRKTYETSLLVQTTPIQLHPKKHFVYTKACPSTSEHKGNLVVSRYHAIPLSPVPGNVATQFEMREDVFDYVSSPPSSQAPVVEWWLNFADSRLFVAYGGPLFAQDEMQVAEHPSLAHLKERLEVDFEQLRPLTRVDGRGTPILIRNIERRCRVAVDANAAEGRPRGLYGNVFSQSSLTAIGNATTVLEPPTITHMIAMASLSGGNGIYSWEQIVDLYTTAYTAFKAAIVEARMSCNEESPSGPVVPEVIIHTGNWGCGAFGGNKPLMAIIQCLAAKSAGVNKLVYHTFNKEGTDGYRAGKGILDDLLARTKGEEERHLTIREILEECNNRNFEWGESDGN